MQDLLVLIVIVCYDLISDLQQNKLVIILMSFQEEKCDPRKQETQNI